MIRWGWFRYEASLFVKVTFELILECQVSKVGKSFACLKDEKNNRSWGWMVKKKEEMYR